MGTSFYSREELLDIGFSSVGNNVLISRNTGLYGVERMVIGNNVRIDDFCVLSGRIILHDYIHIAAFCGLFGGKSGIEIGDFCGVSSRTSIYAESDDYSGVAFTNPTLPIRYRNVICGKVTLWKHAIIGTGSTILPGSEIGEGTAVGSMSLVNRSLDAWGIYVGIPCKRIKERSKEVLELEKQFTAEFSEP